ncbi:unnamed protein product [Psylliodes chrysocephalus]|uniref:Uncharacterized protein n=1 Tax=Psylliodes chrysocephalus TaxID=3402493 RepID=A0A9P0D109_9CUCU|nr:unnamed protein product [Psylliodes chrysocephala]
MKYKTYFKYFSQHCNFAFRCPRTDVCDYCTKINKILVENPNDVKKLEYAIHKRKFARHQEIKNYLLARVKTDNTLLVVEFDYSQNFTVPKLNVNRQFYKRLL